jgi:ABC-type lipoprotein export system ATPase subunit
MSSSGGRTGSNGDRGEREDLWTLIDKEPPSAFEGEGGDTTTLFVGDSGCGKSTLINIIAGYEKQDAGLVTLDGTPLDEYAPHVRAHMGVARTFQAGRLFPQLTVAENVALGARGLGLSGRIARQRSEYVLEVLGITDLEGIPAGGLSHGSARLVGLARALAAQPKYLIMDEPAAGLNEHEVPALLAACDQCLCLCLKACVFLAYWFLDYFYCFFCDFFDLLYNLLLCWFFRLL